MFDPTGPKVDSNITIFSSMCQGIPLQGLRWGLFPQYIRHIDIPDGLLYLFRPIVPNEVANIGHNRVTKGLSRDEDDIPIYSDGDRTALHEAAFQGDISVVQQLLIKGADLLCHDNRGWTALHEAASGGHEEVVQLLLENGANPSAQDNDQRTALHEAASKGRYAASQALLGNGANHSFQDTKRRTPLHLAAYGGHAAVVRCLLDNGADPSCQDHKQQTALQLAESGGHKVVSRVLGGKLIRDQGIASGRWSPSKSSQPRIYEYPLYNAPPPRELYSPFSNDSKSSINLVIAGPTIKDSFSENKKRSEGDEGIARENGKRSYSCEGESCDDGSPPSHASHRDDAGCIRVGTSEGKGKGKRMVDMSSMLQGDTKHQDFCTKRVKKDKQSGGQDVEGRENPKDQFSTHMLLEGRGRPYGCPYFKSNARKYQDCMAWNNLSIDKVREHCRRDHLKPLQCLNCGSYRAGDNDEMSEHHLFGSCERAAEITPIDNDDVEKGESLEKRDLGWKQIYNILFPEENIPSPYWKDLMKVSKNRSSNEGLAPPQTHASTVKQVNEELSHFSKYFQDQCPKLVHEFQIQRRLRSSKQSLPLTSQRTEVHTQNP